MKTIIKNMEEIQKQVKKIVIEYLVKDGHLNMFALTEFIYFDMSKELGKSIIGLENYKKANPDRIKEIDMKICLAHDIGGILRGDKMFIPRSLSYTEYYENN
jgi:hypothetical protein